MRVVELTEDHVEQLETVLTRLFSENPDLRDLLIEVISLLLDAAE